ncbi:hypothetical protein D9M71_272360 [compost metagenome]
MPLGWLTLEALTRLRTSDRFRPLAASASGLTRMRTAWRWPPAMLTMPTPLICASFCAMRVSTRVCSLGSGMVFELMARVSTGVSAGLTLLYTGGAGRSLGSRLVAALMAACTSCSATSSLTSRLKRRVMTEAPPELVEDIWVRPGICPNWRSSGAVTALVITSGLAPG